MIPSLLTALLVVTALAGPASAQLADTVWPKFQHDAQNTGRSDTATGPVGPSPEITWEYRGSIGRTGVTIGENGIVFLGDGRRPITALDPADASVVWQGLSVGRTGQADKSQPTLGANGAIYMGERGNNLWAADAADGTVQWKVSVPTDGDVRTSPAIGPDGTVYMASGSLGAGFLYGLNPDGSERWLTVMGDGIQNISPALSHDGQTLYVGVGRRSVAALDAATGTELWRNQVSRRGRGGSVANHSVVIGDDGTLYFAARDGLFALDPDPQGTGEVLWSLDVAPLYFQSCPALGADGTLYVGASGNVATFFAVNPDGTVRWSYVMGGRGRFRNNQAVVDADGTVYVTYLRTLYAFSAAGDGNGGGEILWQMDFPRRFKNGPTLGGDGSLYVLSGRRLYKIGGSPSGAFVDGEALF